jgi:deoxyribonuclease V
MGRDSKSERSIGMSNLDLKGLREQQKMIAHQISLQDNYRKPLTSVAGIDLAFKDKRIITAVVVMAFPSQKIIHEKIELSTIYFPYIPTFLAFREGPPIVNAIKSLEVKPDVIMINAHGIAHPSFCGCASHVGVFTQNPTIGVAQKILCGKYEVTPEEVDTYEPIVYKKRGVGWIFKSKKGCKPIFISPGHFVSLSSSISITRRCIGKYKLPNPLYYAHKLATETKRTLR